ncbi:type II toxin-antitoxin system VapC family toxin [Demequina sp. NBRC 110051]|uniref:type II toxin-antitoxin system VapC family toxin n=1 Tax=Demequina sp. NBRC 110051 TaxID=1570340 RepID=UPI0009FBD7CB|nr:type II toxin-antitoxin system VapC family toxin [Demequina sp. NBRC 110051]
MIVDSSAIIAIIDAEPDFKRLVAALTAADNLALSSATLVEIHAVIYRRRRADDIRRVDRLLQEFGVEVVAFDAHQARIASEAYREYGRGSGHAANLNLGDCYSYALAMASDEPLLFVGDDFTHTDVRPALGQ